MGRVARVVVVVCGAIVVVQAVALWAATGRGVFTIHFDPARDARERAAATEGVAALFDDTGLQDEAGKLETMPNAFRFGLLPSAYPWRLWDRDLPSVLTVGGPALLCSLVALLAPALRRRTVSTGAGGA